MALVSGALETSVRALETCEPSCTSRPARLFFMLEAHDPQGTARHVVAPEPSPQGDRVWSRGTHGGTGALRVRCHGTHGSAGAHLGK
jgi:hypothetical protein